MEQACPGNVKENTLDSILLEVAILAGTGIALGIISSLSEGHRLSPSSHNMLSTLGTAWIIQSGYVSFIKENNPKGLDLLNTAKTYASIAAGYSAIYLAPHFM